MEVLTSAGFAAPQIEALKAGFPRLGVVDLHSFAYVRKALDPNGINSDHEREYSAGKVPRRGPFKQPTAPSLTLSPRSRHRCCAMPRSITPPWSLTRTVLTVWVRAVGKVRVPSRPTLRAKKVGLQGLPWTRKHITFAASLAQGGLAT